MTKSFTFRHHPNDGYNLPKSLSTPAGSYATVFFCYYAPYYINSISTLSYSYDADTSNDGTRSVRVMWGNLVTGNPYNTDISYTNATNLKNNFKKSKQFIIVRYQIGAEKSSRSGTFRSFTCTGTGDVQALDSVAIGDPIEISNMSALKTHIDLMATTLKMGTNQSITLPTVDTPLNSTAWQTFITKANALPYVSGLTVPGQGNEATTTYYNGIVSAVFP